MPFKLQFDGVNDYVQTNGPHIESITADFTLEVKVTTGASETGDSVVMVRQSDRSNYLIVDQNANNIRFKMDNVNTWSVALSASTDYVVKITRASGVLTCELDGTPLSGNPTDTGWLRIDNFGRWSSSFYKDIGLHYVHFVCPSIPSADRLYDARNTSSGSVLPETINGQNGTLIGFPGDDSQWVSTGGGGTTVAIGLASESDSVFSLNAENPRSYSIGLATEASQAFSISVLAPSVVSLGLATETDSAFSISAVIPKVVSLGLAAEADQAFSITPVITSGTVVFLGTAIESSQAFGIAKINPRTYELGLAAEADQALTIRIAGQETPFMVMEMSNPISSYGVSIAGIINSTGLQLSTAIGDDININVEFADHVELKTKMG